MALACDFHEIVFSAEDNNSSKILIVAVDVIEVSVAEDTESELADATIENREFVEVAARLDGAFVATARARLRAAIESSAPLQCGA